MPPVRSSSAQQSNNGPYQQGRTVGRRPGHAPLPPSSIQRPSRPPPMRPPTQPPPPPPVTNHSGPGGKHSAAPPPPPPMQTSQVEVPVSKFDRYEINLKS